MFNVAFAVNVDVSLRLVHHLNIPTQFKRGECGRDFSSNCNRIYNPERRLQHVKCSLI